MPQEDGIQSSQPRATFESYYLQKSTQELAEDLDKVRGADDFKADSIPFLVHALQQGTVQFSQADRERVTGILRDGKKV
ncbi:ribosome assembly protein 3 [Geosmithia morbida]|uniref:Ribosome assembly protein 3 n=1 Tax=Geosmithia morbida TaxID=1094350 RepID=A0A9P5D0G9_9HYPO|nr:ribosome assembly protein 3 [Geosmithia morbida]KAF4121592.1 ribosome assembly protein 3 [Geosmithia morbida]